MQLIVCFDTQFAHLSLTIAPGKRVHYHAMLLLVAECLVCRSIYSIHKHRTNLPSWNCDTLHPYFSLLGLGTSRYHFMPFAGNTGCLHRRLRSCEQAKLATMPSSHGGRESWLQGSQLGKGALDFALKFLRSVKSQHL